ncbi:D-erythronate dehydrogenase [Serratia marcescens]|uniref:D-erythronate dehydrogenase n=1 Tax=unclassified Serratia (in: enterobacteria) TaxID=2647522 RepID=UPI0024AFDE4C|nr:MULTISPECIES: D-erythronate dehydrogenase [unclassified Serratia (in: enterobacteria)]EMB6252918.1 SDR family oxidoreductase [Serratia marcescens]MDI6974274.1 SDR family oxidoreductase [Serratia sp. Se-RSBMAAmG]MDI9262595.1 SDR family oxidoreductase [Serratia sp. PF2-63]MDI9268447.1 SDR family oxidoreductase [Serratia sp. PF-27]
MNIVITGAAGFLGKKLVKALLKKGSLLNRKGQLEQISQITAFDIATLTDISDPRLNVVCGDISNPEELANLINENTDSVFHLAAIVSGQAEQNFELGMKINVDAARQIMERMRALPQCIRLVTTSSVAVFGGNLPEKVPDEQVWIPQSSYGTQKAMNDLLLSDYSRRGFLDGRSLRMPTIVVRPGKPNAAASSFASGIIREPLNGEEANCPVSTDTRLWLMSPDKAVTALVHGHELDNKELNQGRIINLCGLSVTVEAMIGSLLRIAGDEVVSRISFKTDQAIVDIVNSWPGDFHADYARHLGFEANGSFDEVIEEYLIEKNGLTSQP